MTMWTTREGKQIEVKDMSSTHLLSTVHMIERNRLFSLAEVFHNAEDKEDVLSFYYVWPEQYEEMIQEAQKRQLIHRAPSTKLARKR